MKDVQTSTMHRRVTQLRGQQQPQSPSSSPRRGRSRHSRGASRSSKRKSRQTPRQTAHRAQIRKMRDAARANTLTQSRSIPSQQHRGLKRIVPQKHIAWFQKPGLWIHKSRAFLSNGMKRMQKVKEAVLDALVPNRVKLAQSEKKWQAAQLKLWQMESRYGELLWHHVKVDKECARLQEKETQRLSAKAHVSTAACQTSPKSVKAVSVQTRTTIADMPKAKPARSVSTNTSMTLHTSGLATAKRVSASQQRTTRNVSTSTSTFTTQTKRAHRNAIQPSTMVPVRRDSRVVEGVSYAMAASPKPTPRHHSRIHNTIHLPTMPSTLAGSDHTVVDMTNAQAQLNTTAPPPPPPPPPFAFACNTATTPSVVIDMAPSATSVLPATVMAPPPPPPPPAPAPSMLVSQQKLVIAKRSSEASAAKQHNPSSITTDALSQIQLKKVEARSEDRRDKALFDADQMQQVRLRLRKTGGVRSPGGTPSRQRQHKETGQGLGPEIARALREKFKYAFPSQNPSPNASLNQSASEFSLLSIPASPASGPSSPFVKSPNTIIARSPRPPLSPNTNQSTIRRLKRSQSRLGSPVIISSLTTQPGSSTRKTSATEQPNEGLSDETPISKQQPQPIASPLRS
eukprot:m.65767 g.65767  ORF g.65767 m.65767 type:complete len:626 (-) comp12073_c0_seq2:669-2546(-)